MGIFSFSEDYSIEIHAAYNDQFKYIIPIQVSGPESFLLFAVWTYNYEKKGTVYQANKAFAHYAKKGLLANNAFVIGDFNGNVKWDKAQKNDENRFEFVDSIFKQKGMKSILHSSRNIPISEEPEDALTFFHQKKQERGSIIDYCYASEKFAKSKLEVGSFKKYVEKNGVEPSFSDHAPLIVDITL